MGMLGYLTGHLLDIYQDEGVFVFNNNDGSVGLKQVQLISG